MGDDELAFVDWLRQRERRHPAVELGIGDDMAVVVAGAPGGDRSHGRLLLASDMFLDGVHFDTTCHAPALIGRKSIACNLSDCAAMAVRPLAATVSLALPTAGSMSDARRVLEGAFQIAEAFDLPIVGGDTTRWAHPLAIDVAITATPYDGFEPVRRSGAVPGDVLLVTGPLGGSLLGRHLTFTPRVREARALAETLGDRLHAMIDISDGLSLDLWRLCTASGVGAVLDQRQLERVVSDDAAAAAAEGDRSPLEHALSDGEDFELLLAVAPEAAGDVGGAWLAPVGVVTPSGLALRQDDGRTVPLEPRGYVH